MKAGSNIFNIANRGPDCSILMSIARAIEKYMFDSGDFVITSNPVLTERDYRWKDIDTYASDNS